MYSVVIEKLHARPGGTEGMQEWRAALRVHDAPDDPCLVGAKDPERTNSSANEGFYRPVLTARETPPALRASPEWAWLMCTQVHFWPPSTPPPRPRSVAMTTVAGSLQTVLETLAAG